MAKKERYRLIYDYKHKEKRKLIPSQEEQGTETVNDATKIQAAAYMQNPEIERSQDPYLVWLGKYDNDEETFVEVRSLYEKENIRPADIWATLASFREGQSAQASLFSEYTEDAINEEKKAYEYYTHENEWSNRMILGDSLLAMNSLLHREAMAGQVQMIYIDPPYGIKFGSNWQKKIGDRMVTDGKDDFLTHEPEQIKAYRDTWEIGVHSYLSYLRDRLLVAHNLLHETGSVFVQISDENIHLVRNIMDEVFGSENFISVITVKKTSGLGTGFLKSISDYIIWYAKSKNQLKYRQLFIDKPIGDGTGYTWIELEDGTRRKMTIEEKLNSKNIPKNAKPFFTSDLVSSGYTDSCFYDFELGNRVFKARKRSWKTHKLGMLNLIKKNRIMASGELPTFVKFFDDFPAQELSNLWDDTHGATDLQYVVQTSTKVIERCLLMTTDPSDLVLDITCGSGTTAFVAEQFGRRWITTDTSRIALNIAKQRLMTAIFPYYYLNSEVEVYKSEDKGKIKKTIQYKDGEYIVRDVRQGFVYEEVPHITLKSLANDEPAETETLFDKPYEDKKRIRVAGAFTVETLQNYNPRTFEDLEEEKESSSKDVNFQELVISHLQSAGIRPNNSSKPIIFKRVDPLPDKALNAIGYYDDHEGIEKTAYLFIGHQFSAVAILDASKAVKAAKGKKDCDWLLILGFAFEETLENDVISTSQGKFEMTKVRMHDDLLQNGLRKKARKSDAMFVAIGEPDLNIHYSLDKKTIQVEVLGMDIFDPLKNESKARNKSDIAFFQVDDDYDGSRFIIRQIMFCGGDGKELDKLQKSVEALAKQRNNSKKALESTLKIVVDDDAFDRCYGFISHYIDVVEDKKLAIRIVTHFGEEVTKVITL